MHFEFGRLELTFHSMGLFPRVGPHVEIHHLPTLPTSSFRTSSPTSGAPLAPSGSSKHTTREEEAIIISPPNYVDYIEIYLM